MANFKYVTMQGDTYDLIALDAYGEEKLSYIIIESNPQYSNVIVFSAGIELIVPVIESQSTEEVPPWRR